MSAGLIAEMVKTAPKEGRLLGMDVGQKTIGLATADIELRIVTPLATIQRTKFIKDFNKVLQYIEEYNIIGFIIGLPLHMDGRAGRRAQSVWDFAQEFDKALKSHASSLRRQGSSCFIDEDSGLHRNDDKGQYDPWIALQDERLSTDSVENFVDQSLDMNRRQAKSRGITDQLAAVEILERALVQFQINRNQP